MSHYKEENFSKAMTRETVDEVLKYPVKALPDRGITKETCEHFGVRVALDKDKKIEAIYFPYKKKNKVTGYKKRDLTLPKEHKYHFTSVGSVGVNCELFGQNEGPNGGKKVFITEGEYDALASYQILKEKYPNGEPKVMSIGLGTTNAAQHIGNNLSALEGFHETILAFDMDEATEEESKRKPPVKRGKEATEDVAQLIPNVKVAQLPANDPNQCLMEGLEDKLYWALVAQAKSFVPEEILRGCDVTLEDVLKPLKEGVYIDCFPKLMRKLHGLRRPEMTIVLAPTKSGKTTIVKEIGYGLVKSGGFVGHLFLEEPVEKTIQSYIALDNNKLLPEFRENTSIIPRAAAEKSYKELIDNGRTLYIKANKISPKSVLTTLRYMATMGAEYIILDHLSYVLSGDANHDERKAIDLLLTELASFKKEANIHLIVVAHIKRKDFHPKKNRDGDIIYPYWIPVHKEDGRGSGAFEQLCDNLVVIEPEVINEGGERGRIRLKVGANREWDDTGIADITIMDRKIGRMVPAASNY